MPADYVVIDGQIVPMENAQISIMDAGFLHGAGLFETMRAVDGRVFRLAAHRDRLQQSADAWDIPFSLSLEDLRALCAELLEANDLTQARLRLTLTRGVTTAPDPETRLALTATEFQPYPEQLYQAGMTVMMSAYRQNPESPTCGHKTCAYVDRLLALKAAHTAHCNEALWFTARDQFLAEACMSNVFLVDKQGLLCTPPLTTGGEHPRRVCLPGITRQVVCELATELNLVPQERWLTIADVLGARELFLTNAVMGVMPVTRVERHEVGEAKVGAVTTQLRELYLARLKHETQSAS